MRNDKGLIWILLMTTALTACSAFTSPARMHRLPADTPHWLDYDASRRGAIVTPQYQRLFICAEPSPDVAMEMVERFLLRGGYQGISGEAGARISSRVIELGERTQTIMFLREALYRLCEMSSNFQFSPEEVRVLYEKVIEAALRLAEADLIRARAHKIRASAEHLRRLNEVKDEMRRYLDRIYGIE